MSINVDQDLSKNVVEDYINHSDINITIIVTFPVPVDVLAVSSVSVFYGHEVRLLQTIS
jgi:hypothetical protein